MKVYGVHSRSQESGAGLSAEDRRLLLCSMLRVLVRRCVYHKPVLRDDLRPLVALADDAGGGDWARA
jgi:hypothetical protein